MAEESLDSMGFGPETIPICATQIFSQKLSLPTEEASFYTPSDRWCYWFIRQKMGLRMRKQCTSPLSPEDYIAIHDTLDGFDMDKDYTKEYPQENVFRGLEETVQTVESTFHPGCVWTVWVDLVCDSQFCLYDSLYPLGG